MKTEIIKQSKYKVLTPLGWQGFDGIRKITVPREYVHFYTTSGKNIRVTLDHKVQTLNGFIEAQHLTNGITVITSSGEETVSFIDRFISDESVYDLLEVCGNHTYYANDIINHNCEFQGSSGTLISGAALKALRSSVPILEKDGFKQYVKPIKEHQYAIVADVSRGKGLDYSAFSVVDFTKMPFEQVAVFRDNFITPTDYASFIFRISKMYNEALIMVEVNDIGGQVADTLFLDYGAETLLFTENAGAKGKKIAGGFSGRKVDRGIRTTKTVKNIGCSLLKLLVEQQQLIIHDMHTIEELSRFSKKGASYEAEPGWHDDLVMGLVLFAWLSNQQYFKELNDINTIAKLRDRTEQEIEDDLLPFGFFDDGSVVSDDVVVELTQWGY